jgi:hypothetical protein
MLDEDVKVNQSDQIGRIFAQCAIVCFGQFFKNYTSSPKLWATLFQRIDYVLILTKNGLGYSLGDFFTNSSGLPEVIIHRSRLRHSFPEIPFSQKSLLLNLGSLCDVGRYVR